MSGKIQGTSIEIDVVFNNKNALEYLKDIKKTFEDIKKASSDCFNSISKDISKNDKLLNTFSTKLKGLEFQKLQNNFNILSVYFKNLEKDIERLVDKTEKKTERNRPRLSREYKRMRRKGELWFQNPNTNTDDRNKDKKKNIFQKSFDISKDIFKNFDVKNFSFNKIKDNIKKNFKDIPSLLKKYFSFDKIKLRSKNNTKFIGENLKNFSKYILPQKEETPFLDQYTTSVSSLTLAIDSLGSKNLSKIFEPIKKGNLIITNLKKIKKALVDITHVDGKFNFFKTLKFGALTTGLYLVIFLFGKFNNYISNNEKIQKSWQNVIEKTKKIIKTFGKILIEFFLALFGFSAKDIDDLLVKSFDKIGRILDTLGQKLENGRKWIDGHKDSLKKWGDLFKKIGLIILDTIEIIGKFILAIFGINTNNQKKGEKDNNSNAKDSKLDKFDEFSKKADMINEKLDKFREKLGEIKAWIDDTAETINEIGLPTIMSLVIAISFLFNPIGTAIALIILLIVYLKKLSEEQSWLAAIFNFCWAAIQLSISILIGQVNVLIERISAAGMALNGLFKMMTGDIFGGGKNIVLGVTKFFTAGFKGEKSIKKEFTGTNHFQGGFTTINEKGDELILGPTGMVVANNPSTTNIMRDLATVKGNLSHINFKMNEENTKRSGNNIIVNIGNISNKSDIDYLTRQISMLDLS